MTTSKSGKARSRGRPNEDEDDDILSYCGSISGETFSSRRSKAACSLRQHSIDLVAQKLKDYPFPDDLSNNTKAKQAPDGGERRRLNQTFHHFRFLVVMLGGLSFGIMVLLRYNISVAILNMVNQTALYLHEHPDRTVDDFLAEGYHLGGDFDWDNEIQNMIMSWYMIAYTLPQVGATKLGLIVGCRLTTPISLCICALATLLTPLAAYWGGWQWVIVLRLINGVGAAAVLPMMLSLIEKWMPYDEITLGLTLSNLVQAVIGSASPLIAGYLCSIHWSYAFYVPGVGALVFCAIWLMLVADRPDESWLISQQELDLICGCNNSSNNNNKNHSAHHKEHDSSSCCGTSAHSAGQDQKKGVGAESEKQDGEKKPGLIDVLKVPSFYAYILCCCLHCSAFNGFIFILPAYLRQFLKIGISQNGLYNSIIQSGAILSVMWPHPLLYFLQSKLKLSVTTSGRITYAIGCVVVATAWIYVGSFHHYQLLLLFIGRCFHGCNEVVVTASLMSNYASTGISSMAFSMVNTVGNLSVVFVSTSIGWYLDYTGQSRDGWFWIMALLGSTQIVMLIIFATLIRSGPIDFKREQKNQNLVSVISDQHQIENTKSAC